MATPDPVDQKPSRLVLVTGPSGAGRSTAITALEDLGYEAIDNLPLFLVPALLSERLPTHAMALGIDTRNREFTTDALLAAIDDFAARVPHAFEVLYLDSAEEVLLRRFSETRRRHPMSPGEDPRKGISREKALLGPVRERADVLIETDEMTPHDLRAEIGRLFALEQSQDLVVSLHSFSYKRSLPRSADMVLDCRFLRNPHWQAELREHTGLEPEVADYVQQDPRYADFIERVTGLCRSLLPAYKAEGKSHFSIAFGCTGGKHRSVAVTEAVAAALALDGWQVSIRHRELERGIRTSRTLVSGVEA